MYAKSRSFLGGPRLTQVKIGPNSKTLLSLRLLCVQPFSMGDQMLK